jgi:uncharacterized protein (TIGR02186 family)
MNRLTVLFAFLFTLVFLAVSSDSVADTGSLVTELQTEHVDVTTHFTGQNILIFGALSKPGDVIIKVTSPDESVALSRKTAIGPLWLDGGKLTVRDTPGLFYLLSSRPIDQIVKPDEQQRYGLRLHNALMNAKTDRPATEAMGDWKAAFRGLKVGSGYYRKLSDAVKLVENRLFSANIELPAKIPLGTYRLDVYLAQDGLIISHQTRNLEVHQVQLERWIANAVNSHSWLFGFSFTLFALTLGLTLGMVLRRDSDA